MTVAKILAEVRDDALLDYEPGKGDGPWGLGCRVYERSCSRIAQAADALDWLRVIEPPLHFVFAIGLVPFRFYRGEPDSPRTHCLARNPAELEQQQESFEFIDSEDDGWFWRMAVVADPDDGTVTGVTVLQARDSGDTRNTWNVPLEDAVSVLSALGDLPAPVPLPAAEVDVPDPAEFENDVAGEA